MLQKTLEKLENFSKTDIRYLLKNSTWLLGSNVLTSVLSLLLAIAFANLATEYTYGIYQYILSIASILAIPSLSGINTSLTQSVAQGNEGNFLPSLRTRIKWATIGTTLSICVASYYIYFQNNILGLSFLVAGLTLPFWDTFGIYSFYLQGKKQFKAVSISEGVSYIIPSFAVITALFLTDNIIYLISTFFISWSISHIIIFYVVVKMFPPNSQKSTSNIVYGKHITALGVITTLSNSLDKIFLWHLLGPVQVAVYTYSLTVSTKINSLVKIINKIALPKFSENTNRSGSVLLTKIFKATIATIPLAIVYYLLVPYVFTYLFPIYKESIPYAQALSLTILLQPFTLIKTYLTAKTAVNNMYTYHVLSPLFKIISMVAGIILFGMWGAIISVLLSKLFDSLLLLYMLQTTKHD